MTDEIVLTTPITQPTLSRVRVSDISDHPDQKKLSFRLSIGFVDASGQWIEVRDDHMLVEDLPAQPRYTNLKNLMRTSGKSAEVLILNWVNAKYPGTIQ